MAWSIGACMAYGSTRYSLLWCAAGMARMIAGLCISGALDHSDESAVLVRTVEQAVKTYVPKMEAGWVVLTTRALYNSNVQVCRLSACSAVSAASAYAFLRSQ